MFMCRYFVCSDFWAEYDELYFSYLLKMPVSACVGACNW